LFDDSFLSDMSRSFVRLERRLPPPAKAPEARAYAYRRKPGRDEQEREIQNTHNSRKDVRRNRFASRLPVLLWVKRWPSVDCTWRGF
jgi:hypothetical protein